MSESVVGMETKTKKKSVLLTPAERDALRAYRNQCHTAKDCADFFGFHVNVLERALFKGSASEDSITIIREKLPTIPQSANEIANA